MRIPAALSIPKMDVLATICRGIHAKRPVAIRYYSMSSGESERVIVPFALVDTGMRWHVRAFDRKSREFRDFVVTRIEAPTLLYEEPQANERQDNDIQWTRIVELDFVPHPSVERPDIIKMDYRRCHADPRAQFNQEPDGKRDPEMHQTKKGNQYYFGMKAHIGVDDESGLVHSVVGTAPTVADVTHVDKLLHGDENVVCADAGYTGVEKRLSMPTEK